MAETLLIEIFTEELPPKALGKLGLAFAEEVFARLKTREFVSEESINRKWFATPRRLAVSIPGVLPKSADKPTRVKVLPVNVALDAQGQPTPALTKKLASLGFPQLTVADLERAVDGKAESFFHSYTAPGIDLATGLQAVLTEAIAALPIPKTMRYQTETGEDVLFVRPAHGLVVLYGAEVVPVAALGLTADRVTHGHRFQGRADVTLAHAREYEEKLEAQGGVVASFEKRLAAIQDQLQTHAAKLEANPRLEERQELLAEVTGLVENPTVYVGTFEPEFLEVPQECLILTMQQNQKYFPLFDANGKLLNKFLLVSNMRLADAKNVTEGNQRVIRPRLADARFFYEQDRKQPLVDRAPQLANVVYHNKLGSQWDRIGRLQRLASAIAEKLGADPKLADRAALLCKADLVTNMVGEFPELQGIMGRYYARHDGEDPQVAEAIEAHYKPRFAGDALPPAGPATALALAERLDTLIGIFGVGQIPTGDKDPFGLRRAALGVLRILQEGQLPLDLRELLELSIAQFTGKPVSANAPTLVYEFMLERLKNHLREVGFEPEIVDAVVSQAPTRIDLVLPRVEAVRAFRKLPESESLSAANKRTRNILKKAEGVTDACNTALFIDDAEIRLHASVVKLTPEVSSCVAVQDYTGALKQLAGIRGDVDIFFRDVMVMADDPNVRTNRLALLAQLEKLMNQVADISKLAA
ncbi:MAG TPA: glycine--tRNA ligase subunit beta [Burkholderiales bacterium]|nr:glycine--tRNA ligase subunit beta [Burkholderiales bacterium]